MRWLAIAVLVASCERSEPPLPPAPKDAAPADAACRRQPDPVRLRAVDALRDDPSSVAPELVDYVALELAVVYARIGADTRALLQKTTAHRTLDDRGRTDPVDRVLLAIYDARIERAQRCLPDGLPDSVLAEVQALDGDYRRRLEHVRRLLAAISHSLGE